MVPVMPLKPLWHLSCVFRAVFLALRVSSVFELLQEMLVVSHIGCFPRPV